MDVIHPQLHTKTEKGQWHSSVLWCLQAGDVVRGTTCAWHAKVLGWIPVPLPPVTTVTMEDLEWYGRTNDNLLNSNMNFLFLPINTLE